MASKSENKGWGFPLNSRKAHYFVDGQALCGKWLFFGRLEEGNDNSPDNCTACKKAVQKRRAKEAVQKLREKGKISF